MKDKLKCQHDKDEILRLIYKSVLRELPDWLKSCDEDRGEIIFNLADGQSFILLADDLLEARCYNDAT
jgi:hypothetical protein